MRPIDADTLKAWFFRPYSNEESYCNMDVAKAIDNAPTVDAVPVVRCEKCAYHSDILLKGMEDFVWCNFFNLYRCKDSFCSCGQVE